MESMIIEEMRAFLKLGMNPKQEKYFVDTIAVAKRVEVVRAARTFSAKKRLSKYAGSFVPKSKVVIEMRIC